MPIWEGNYPKRSPDNELQQALQLELARASYQESQTIYRELALTKPDLYRPALAGALVWLGDVQWALNMPEAAQVKFENALTIFREMDEVKPGVFGPLWRIR